MPVGGVGDPFAPQVAQLADAFAIAFKDIDDGAFGGELVEDEAAKRQGFGADVAQGGRQEVVSAFADGVDVAAYRA